MEVLLAGGGASHRAVGKRFNLSRHAVDRHWANHVTDERKACLILGPVEREALSSRVAEESSSILDHFKAVRSGLYDLFLKAHEAADGQAGALLAGRLHENLNSIARLTGEIASSPLVQINQQTNNNISFTADPQFAMFQADLIRALSRHPEARKDVIDAFRRLEAVVEGGNELPRPALEALPHASA
jgi:hypothetical protein